METVTAACQAMATRFEVVLHGSRAVVLRAAAEEAFREIERLHAQLNLYSPTSEISAINAHSARQPVRVEPGLFRLLQLAQRLHAETDGAFDITIAPLVRCWGFMGGSGALPSEDDIAAARERVGMQHVLLNEEESTIQFAREGMMIDLGSIGKGYALDVATELLREAGVESGLIHGGTSTVAAIGRPPDLDGWKVALGSPAAGPETNPTPKVSPEDESKRPLAIVELRDETLSVSAVHGKSFQAGGKTYGHVLDPRTGRPAASALLAAVVLPSATESDALSTALLLDAAAALESLRQARPELRGLVVTPGDPPGGDWTVLEHRIPTCRKAES